MCGIVGFLMTGALPQPPDEIIRRMTDAIIHRGPDAEGVWLDNNSGIALGHRRLSILDLSPEGSQPMVSCSGRYIIVFNGEIYNFREIRLELDEQQIRPWRGHSDTEVMLSAIEEWGIEGALKRFVGMFAFALWNREERTLTIARDRLGEKPLYYGWCNGTFLFASELKALRVHPAFVDDIDRDSITLLLRHSCIPAPYSIYKGIRKLLPGTYLTVTVGTPKEDTPIVYWSAREVAQAGQANLFDGSDQEAIDQLEILLQQSIRQQMVADVPLGAFLSGGIDSSTIAALMQAQSSAPIKTFTIGFYEEDYNEAIYAKEVAGHLGTEHTELYVTPQQALDVIPRLPQLYDEPFSDSSQIPTFLISELTRRHVTVSLSGDAGDELFGGYNRYAWGHSIQRSVGWLPTSLRKQFAHLLSSRSEANWNKTFKNFDNIIPPRFRYNNPGDKILKLSGMLDFKNQMDLYKKLISHWESPSSLVLGSTEPRTILNDTSIWDQFTDIRHAMMFTDMTSYLPDDILVKVDRAAMGVSLETRVPFIDHRVVEFAWQIPISMKIRHGQGKWILRQVLKKYVPNKIIDRPKMGFGVPLDSWLRGPLREWAENLLSTERLKNEGYFDPTPIRQKWAEHLSGSNNWQYYLWDVLMFQAWLNT